MKHRQLTFLAIGILIGAIVIGYVVLSIHSLGKNVYGAVEGSKSGDAELRFEIEKAEQIIVN